MINTQRRQKSPGHDEAQQLRSQLKLVPMNAETYKRNQDCEDQRPGRPCSDKCEDPPRRLSKV